MDSTFYIFFKFYLPFTLSHIIIRKDIRSYVRQVPIYWDLSCEGYPSQAFTSLHTLSQLIIRKDIRSLTAIGGNPGDSDKWKSGRWWLKEIRILNVKKLTRFVEKLTRLFFLLTFEHRKLTKFTRAFASPFFICGAVLLLLITLFLP